MKIFAALLFLTALAVGAASVASARNCTTTCTPTYGGGQTCNTHCW